MDVRGFGPQTVKELHEKLNLQTCDDVIAAFNDGSISKLKGFGMKKEENMKRGLKLHKESEQRMNLWDALSLGENILS